MNSRIISTIILLGFTITSIAQNKFWSSSRPDGHAPIGVMADHYHEKGEVMFSYRFMPMRMDEKLSNSDKITDKTIFNNYMVSPHKMGMEMHMLGLMYGLTNKLTLMIMVNYISKSMDLKTKSGTYFNTKSNGFGDISISGMVKILNKNRQSLHANIGFSIPTGAIEKRSDTPMMKNTLLAYPMQIGSGTFDPFLGATYLGQSNSFSWGFQSIYKIRLGKNTKKYSLGNQFKATSWGAIKVSDYLSFSTRLDYFNLEKINGKATGLNTMMMPLSNTVNSGRNQLNLGIGSNLLIAKGRLKNLRFSVEFTFPLSQSVNGVQMKDKLMGVFGIQYTIANK